MQGLLAFSRRIDRLTGSIGHAVSWLIVVAVVISAANAIIRKVFDTGSNAALEVQWWLFAMVFLLAAPWTLRDNEHIRIDVVSSRLSQSARDWIDLIGHAFFLLPVAGMMLWTSWAYALKSWVQYEGSANAGGLPQWPIKMIIPIAFGLLFLQGLSELIKRVGIMRGYGNGVEHDVSYHEAAAGRDQHTVD